MGLNSNDNASENKSLILFEPEYVNKLRAHEEIKEEKKSGHMRVQGWVLLASVIVLVAFSAFFYLRFLNEYRSRKERLKELVDGYEDMIRESVPTATKTFPDVRYVTIRGTSSLSNTHRETLILQKVTVNVGTELHFALHYRSSAVGAWLEWVKREYGKRIDRTRKEDGKEYWDELEELIAYINRNRTVAFDKEILPLRIEKEYTYIITTNVYSVTMRPDGISNLKSDEYYDSLRSAAGYPTILKYD